METNVPVAMETYPGTKKSYTVVFKEDKPKPIEAVSAAHARVIAQTLYPELTILEVF